MVKYIPDVNSWQLLFVRCSAQLVTMVPIMVTGKHHILGTPDWATRWRLAAQGVLGGLLLLGIFEAVARLPFSAGWRKCKKGRKSRKGLAKLDFRHTRRPLLVLKLKVVT